MNSESAKTPEEEQGEENMEEEGRGNGEGNGERREKMAGGRRGTL